MFLLYTDISCTASRDGVLDKRHRYHKRRAENEVWCGGQCDSLVLAPAVPQPVSGARQCGEICRNEKVPKRESGQSIRGANGNASTRLRRYMPDDGGRKGESGALGSIYAVRGNKASYAQSSTSTMDILVYYSIGFGAMLAAPLLPGLYALFYRHVVPLFRCKLAKMRYRRIGGFTRLRLFRGATCLELLLVSIYIAGNGVAVAIKAIKGATIASSAALAASINLIPLLLGGRTSRVADVIGVSRPAYYVAHHWIGCTAIIEGLAHGAIRLHEARQTQRYGNIALSGCIVSLPRYSSCCKVPELTIYA